MRYSEERKQAILAKLQAPYNRTVSDLAAEEGAALFHARPEQKRYMWAAFVRKLLRDSPSFAE